MPSPHFAVRHFTHAKIADPAPRENDRPKRRLAQINAEIKVAQYRIVYFGDSITQGWDKALWEQNLVPRHVFNAGVDGDRTEHCAGGSTTVTSPGGRRRRPSC